MNDMLIENTIVFILFLTILCCFENRLKKWMEVTALL